MRNLHAWWMPLWLVAAALAQAPDAVIDDEALLLRIEANCEALRTKGELKTVPELAKDCDGRRCELAFAPPAKDPLPTVALRARLQRSTWIVGHYYPCEECRAWHFTASSGFAVGKDGVIATCFHLLDDDPEMPGACLAVASYDGVVYPVTAVLAADHAADVALLQCTARDLVPLPLRLDALAGERIYCFSNPDHQFACFTEGLIARRYVVRNHAPGTEPQPPVDRPRGKDGKAPADAAVPSEHTRAVDPKARLLTMLQVTCDFAVGSSGAPITDDRGNVIGIAQSTATVLVDPDAEPAETQMVARSAVPAQVLRALAK